MCPINTIYITKDLYHIYTYVHVYCTYIQAIELDNTHVNNLCNYGLFLCEIRQQYTAAETYYKQSLFISLNKHTNTLYNYAVMLDTITIPPPPTSATTASANNTNTTTATNNTTSPTPTNATNTTNNSTNTNNTTPATPSTATSDISYTSINRKQEAEVYYRKCIELDRNHSYAMYNLAVLLEGREKMYKLSQVSVSSAITPSSSSPAPTKSTPNAITLTAPPSMLTSITEGKENDTDTTTLTLPAGADTELHTPPLAPSSEQPAPPPLPTSKEIGEWYRLAMVSAPQDAAIAADYGRYI